MRTDREERERLGLRCTLLVFGKKKKKETLSDSREFLLSIPRSVRKTPYVETTKECLGVFVVHLSKETSDFETRENLLWGTGEAESLCVCTRTFKIYNTDVYTYTDTYTDI